MIRFFKSPQPGALFIVPLMVLVLWTQAFFQHTLIVNETGMPLYRLFSAILIVLPQFVQVLLAIAFVSFEAIYLNILVNRHEVLYKNSYLPALMYVILMSLLLPLLQFHPLIFVNILLLRALDKLFKLFKNDSPTSTLFDSFFLVSVASLFYLPAISLLVLFLMALAILRPFSVREWLISLIGFLLPYFFLSVYFFWTDQLITGWKNLLKHFIPGHTEAGFVFEKPLVAIFILLGLMLLLSLKRLVQNFYKNTVRTRSNQQILILLFIIAAASSFMLSIVPLFQLTMLAIPMAVFYGYYFLAARRRLWFSEMLVWLLIILVVWNRF